MGFAENWRRLLGTVAACLALFSTGLTPSYAIMATATDGFLPAGGYVTEQLSDVPEVAELARNARIRWQPTSIRRPEWELGGSPRIEYPLIIIRFENKCGRDVCPTAFFSGDISKASYLGLILLPPKTTMSDTSARLCRTCPSFFALLFEGTGQGRVGVGILEGRLVIGSTAFSSDLRSKAERPEYLRRSFWSNTLPIWHQVYCPNKLRYFSGYYSPFPIRDLTGSARLRVPLLDRTVPVGLHCN